MFPVVLNFQGCTLKQEVRHKPAPAGSAAKKKKQRKMILTTDASLVELFETQKEVLNVTIILPSHPPL